MKHLAKAFALKVLSALPGGAKIYCWGQKNITHSLDPTPERVRQKVEVARLYLDTLARLGTPLDLAAVTHVDLGTGWHPTIPLFFYACGCDRQWLFDVAPLLDDDLFHGTVATLRRVLTAAASSPWPLRRSLPAFADEKSVSDSFHEMGMTYVAPYVEVLRGLSECVDVVTCTQALQHIDIQSLRTLFSDIFRALKPGGHFLATVHLKDLYVPLGRGLPYNHLRYSPALWALCVNSRLISFNRLKAPDFRELLETAGFDLPHFEVEYGSAEDLAALARVRTAAAFAHYSPEELAAKHLFFVARKP